MEYKYIKTDYLEMVSGGDSALVRELVVMFAEQVEEILTEMKLHLLEKNYYALGLLAHKAKSSVAIMGMDDLAEVLRNFEQQAKEGRDPGDYEHYIARFGDDTKAAMAELDTMINKL